MRVLVACERSGIVREAFRERGHDAWSCDLWPADDNSPYHFQCDARPIIQHGSPYTTQQWDLLIAHPECRYLCSSGLHRNRGDEKREFQTDLALAWVYWLMRAPIARIAIENPVGRIGTAIRKADQYVQPYQFGDNASKRTGLWLKGLPKLVVPHEEKWIAPRIVDGKPRWGNQTDSGQNRLGPSPTRSAARAQTYQGIANAMAEQWGIL